jgi:NitT/TauT family transport system substrate-binding protein
MPDDQIAYGIAKMKEYGLVTGGDAVTLGVMAITDARWKKTCDFMKSQTLLKPETDCSLAYTTELVKDLRVLP